MASVSELLSFIKALRSSEAVILIIIMIFIILGNSLVLVVTWRERNLHQPNKYFIACLAVADLLIGIIVVPIRVYQLLSYDNGGITSIHLCRFYLWIDFFTATASIYTLTLISFDRYLKLSKPFQYKSRMTTSTSLKVIFIICLISIAYSTLGMFPYADSRGIEIFAWGCVIENKIFFTFVAVGVFFVPTIVIVIMYALIFAVTHKRQKMLRNGELGLTSNDQNQQSAFLQDLKVIRMLMFVAGAFIFCWGPFFILLLINYYRPTPVSCNKNFCENSVFFMLVLRRLVILLPVFNSLLNPLIYAYFDQNYREAFKLLFQRIMRLPASRRGGRELPQAQ